MQNKKELTDIIVEALTPMRLKREALLDESTELERILKDGAEKARAFAAETMTLVYQAMGMR